MPNLAETPDRIDELSKAFMATEYRVETGAETVTVRIGESAPALDRLLSERLNGRSWAIITAHNPDGRVQPADRNAAAHLELEQHLRTISPSLMLEVCNRDPSGRWPDEPAWLFEFEDISRADRLAHRFGQRAIVTGRPGRPAALRIYDDVPDSRLGGVSAVDA